MSAETVRSTLLGPFSHCRDEELKLVQHTNTECLKNTLITVGRTDRSSGHKFMCNHAVYIAKYSKEQDMKKELLQWKKTSRLMIIPLHSIVVTCPVDLLIPFPPGQAAIICQTSKLYLLMWKTQSVIKDAWERDTSGRQNESKDRIKGWNEQQHEEQCRLITAAGTLQNKQLLWKESVFQHYIEMK